MSSSILKWCAIKTLFSIDSYITTIRMKFEVFRPEKNPSKLKGQLWPSVNSLLYCSWTFPVIFLFLIVALFVLLLFFFPDWFSVFNLSGYDNKVSVIPVCCKGDAQSTFFLIGRCHDGADHSNKTLFKRLVYPLFEKVY